MRGINGGSRVLSLYFNAELVPGLNTGDRKSSKFNYHVNSFPQRNI